MTHVQEILSLDVYRFDAPGGTKLLVHATCEVPTSGWSDVRLAPRFPARDPGDGLLEFDVVARAPAGCVVDATLRLGASMIVGLPDWCRGVRAYAAINSALAIAFTAATQVHSSEPTEGSRQQATMIQAVAVYEDGFEPEPSAACRRLRHELLLALGGPEDVAMRRCLQEVACSAASALVVAVYPQGGGALWAAASALIVQVQSALGSDYRVHLDDRVRWIEPPA